MISSYYQKTLFLHFFKSEENHERSYMIVSYSGLDLSVACVIDTEKEQGHKSNSTLSNGAEVCGLMIGFLSQH